MLEFWNNTEPFMKIIYGVLLVSLLILALCIYKLWRWPHWNRVVDRLRESRENRKDSVFYALFYRINKMRTIWYCAGCAALIALLAVLRHSLSGGWQAGGILGGMVILYLVNNRYVDRRWRCPVCDGRLPGLVGRSSLRPKWTDSCPHCGYGSAQTASDAVPLPQKEET